MDNFLSQALQVQLFRIATKPVPLVRDFSGIIAGFGTCLSAEMILHFGEVGFRTSFDHEYAHHYGIQSLSHFLELVAGERPIGEDDLLVENDGSIMVYPLNLASLRFRGPDARANALGCLRRNVEACRATIRSASLFLITLGTARVFHIRRNGRAIARLWNVHQEDYLTRVLSVTEHISLLERVATQLATIREAAAAPPPIVFAISPQRYLFEEDLAREGLDPYVDGIRCKSVMRVAVEEAVARRPDQLFYFPAFEMVIEELRTFDSLAHYDFFHVGRSTNPYLSKRFLQTFSSAAIVDQLNLSVEAGLLRDTMVGSIKGGLPGSDPQLLAAYTDFQAKLASAVGPVNPITRRIMTDLARTLGSRP